MIIITQVIIVNKENLYISNPYWKENKCGKLVSKYFNQNCYDDIQFFEQPKTFPGCDLKAGILNKMFELPLIGKDPYSKTPGVFIHPIRFFQEFLQLKVNYSFEDFKGEYVLRGETLIQEARINERHIDLLHATYNEQYYYVFDLTDIFYIDEYLWAMNKRPNKNPLMVLFSIFRWGTWFCIFIVFIVMTLIWKEFRNFMNSPKHSNCLKSFQEVFPMSIGVVIKYIPNTIPNRVLMMAYIIYSFYTVNYFQVSK